MKQNRLAFLFICVAAFLACAEARAQATVDGQPSVLKEDKGQSNYVYDLKLLIKKSKDNIKGVNEKIKEQAVIKRNQQREQKAREYYEQALKLHAEGRLEEARQLFDKAIRITEHPEMKYYIKESERRSKLQRAALQREETDQERRANEDQKLLAERAENSYQTAVTLYKQQKFREAKDEFVVVEELYPDYKAVRSYLQIVEQDIIQSEHLNMKEQTKEIDRQQREEEIARLREKELWRKEVDKKEEERQQQLRKQAQGVYDQALKLFDQRLYTAARDKFQEVEWVVPDYKATRAYLTRIENGINDEKQKLTQERQRELEKQRWQEVLNDKKTSEERRKAFEQREQEKLLQVKDQAEFIYAAAVGLFEKDLLDEAKEKFNEVAALYPEYKSTADYLKRIDQVVREKAEREALKKKTADERRIWEETVESRKKEKEKFKLLAGEADVYYNDAMALYRTGRLIEAKEKFLEVDQRVPDYKSTRTYLKRIDGDIELLVKAQNAQDSMAAQREELEKMRTMRDKAEPVYLKAIAAYNAKDLTAAKAGFEEVQGLYPDYKKTGSYLNRIVEETRVKEVASERLSREREAAAMYAQAVALYQARQFEDAKRKFLSVEATMPGYDQTEDFLGRIDDDILKKKESDLTSLRENRVKGLYDEALVLYQNGKLSDAKEKLFEVEVLYPGYKETTRLVETINADIHKRNKDVVEREETQTAEKFYNEAVALYGSADYAGAKEKFIKTEVVRPDYKDCSKYLARIDLDIARKKKEDDLRTRSHEAEPLYAQAVSLYKDANFIAAKNKFVQVQALIADYKDIASYLARVDKDIRDQEARLAKEDKTRRSASLYSEAVNLSMERRFVEAKEKFLEVSDLDPTYKNVRGYLAKIDRDIREEAQLQTRLLAEQRVVEPYAQGVTLYHDGDLAAAKEKFIEVAQLMPDYKKNKFYLDRVYEELRIKKGSQEKERAVKAEALYKEAAILMADDKTLQAYTKFCELQTLYPDYKSVRVNIERLRKIGVEKGLDLPGSPEAVLDIPADEKRLISLYKEAVQLYKDKKYDEARVKFEVVEEMQPGYRSTRQYFESINELKDAAAKSKETEARIEAKVKAEAKVLAEAEARASAKAEAMSLADERELKVKNEEEPAVQIKAPVTSEDAKAIAKLSARSNVIYQQIKSLSEDKQLSDASRTFEKVDHLIEHLDAEHRRIVREIAREKKAGELEVLRIRRAEKRDTLDRPVKGSKGKIETKIGSDARDLELPSVEEREEPRQQESRNDLAVLKERARTSQREAEAVYRQALGLYRAKDYDAAKERLLEVQKIVPEYKDTVKILIRVERAQDQVKMMVEENKDRENIKQLAQKATALNMELLELSQKKDYLSIERRFNDLESILKEIELVKGRMVDRQNEFVSHWEKKTSKPREDADDSPFGKARMAYKEGQRLYAAESFAEARVKFMDALEADPSFKAPMSYVTRIDRILEQRDFETHQGQKPPVRASVDGAADPLRAAEVSAEGVDLYQAKRYREARIKFEELLQIGTPADQKKAAQYLKLVEQGLAKEKKVTDAEQREQEDRYWKERRADARLAWERDKKQEQRERKKTQELMATQRELDIRQQQELRTIEDQNLKQRREVLEKKSKALSQALRDNDQKPPELSAGPVGEDPQKALIRRNQEEVQAILKEPLVVAPPVIVVPAAVIPSTPSSVKNEDPELLLLQQAAERERQQLEEQRSSIRKEFEEGVDRLYNEAIGLFKKKMYDEARQDFEQVDELIKDYKKTAQYLKETERYLSGSAR
jgi:TolA-binding protein